MGWERKQRGQLGAIQSCVELRVNYSEESARDGGEGGEGGEVGDVFGTVFSDEQEMES